MYKQEYNQLLKREQKGVEYLDGDRTPEELKRGLEVYEEVLGKINRMIENYGIEGENILGGYDGKPKNRNKKSQEGTQV